MKNKKQNIFTKEFKIEAYLVMALAIFCIILGILAITNVIELDPSKSKNSKMGIFFIILGLICLILAILEFLKQRKKASEITSKAYEFIKKCETNGNDKLKEMLLLYDFNLLEPKNVETIIDYIGTYSFLVSKDKYLIIVEIKKASCYIQITLMPEYDKMVEDEFYGDDEMPYTTILLKQETDINEVLKNVDAFLNENIEELDMYFEKYKIQ